MNLINKKTSYVVGIILLILVLTYFIAENKKMEEVVGDSTHIIFNSPDEAFNAADLVIVASATGDSSNITKVVNGYPEGYTLTNVKVTRVLKNEINEDIGNYISIAEPYFVWDNGLISGKQKFTYEGYSELQEDAAYILFLKWDDGINGYWINSLEQGKFNIDGKDNKEKAVEGKSEQFKALKNAVIEKFN